MAADQHPLSDDEIIAQDKRSYRSIFILITSFIGVVASVILLFLASRAHFIPVWLVNALGVVLLLGWLFFIFTRVKPGIPPPDEAFGEDYLRKTIDLQHRRWRFVIFGTLLNLFLMATVVSRLRNDNFPVVSLLFACVALVAVLTVSFGPGFFLPFYRRALSDELLLAQRAKVAQFGYILAVVEMCAMVVATAYRTRWTIEALPLVIVSAITLPWMYFLILDWRASWRG